MDYRLRPRLIPTLLLKGRGLYKTVKFKNPVYVGDPINAVRIFNDKGADEIILLDIHATPTARGPDFELIADIASEAFVPLCYGGGVTSLDQIERLLKLGIEKISINSAATDSMPLVTEAARLFGSQSVVVGIDVRKSLLGRYRRVASGAKVQLGDPVVEAVAAEAAGAGELLLYSVDRDGTMEGFDQALVRSVANATSIPLIASGGAASLADMLNIIKEGGASGAAGGSIFVFQGKHRAVLITYPDEQEIAAGQRGSERGD